jgi:glycerate 2-kinase
MAESGRELAERIYRAAVAGADPAVRVGRALDPGQFTGQRTFVTGLGKAARAMTSAALEIIGPKETFVVDGESGDHPVPGLRSERAADDLGAFLSRIHPNDRVLVLLSGGTSSLIAAPVDGISRDDLTRLFTLLLRSGLDIHQTNMVRKRFCRWGGGRLAERIAGANVQVLAISDVSGDRLGSIGSGPCVPDPARADDVIAMLEGAKLWLQVPASVRSVLEDTRLGGRSETPKPGDPAFARVTHSVIANNTTALDAAEVEARGLGLTALRLRHPHDERSPEISGEARAAGQAIARATGGLRASSCLLFGGETTVTLSDASGQGGRCQELALAAALVLEELGMNDITLLAAGTDGRDGPTDAAGAVIDSKTAGRIRAAGLDPVRHLERHDVYPALDAAGCLLRTGPTGTNVRDVVVAVRMTR